MDLTSLIGRRVTVRSEGNGATLVTTGTLETVESDRIGVRVRSTLIPLLTTQVRGVTPWTT